MTTTAVPGRPTPPAIPSSITVEKYETTPSDKVEVQSEAVTNSVLFSPNTSSSNPTLNSSSAIISDVSTAALSVKKPEQDSHIDRESGSSKKDVAAATSITSGKISDYQTMPREQQAIVPVPRWPNSVLNRKQQISSNNNAIDHIDSKVKSTPVEASIAQITNSPLWKTQSATAVDVQLSTQSIVGDNHVKSVAPRSVFKQTNSVNETRKTNIERGAPNSFEATQDGPNSGTVMLDGRVIGDWLVDRITRDASRPPSGTTFFDARQTPPWSISGLM